MKNKFLYLLLFLVLPYVSYSMDKPESWAAELAKKRYQKYPNIPQEHYLKEFVGQIGDLTQHLQWNICRMPYAEYYDDFIRLMEDELAHFKQQLPKMRANDLSLERWIFTSESALKDLKKTITERIIQSKIEPFDPLKHLPQKMFNPIPDKKESLSYRPTLKQIGIGTIAIWTSAELYHAYKIIKTDEWNNAGILKPVLLATRTVKNMVCRPAQIINALEKKLLLKTPLT